MKSWRTLISDRGGSSLILEEELVSNAYLNQLLWAGVAPLSHEIVHLLFLVRADLDY